MNFLQNLEPNKTYDLLFDLKTTAQTDDKVLQDILTYIQQKTLQVSDKLSIIKTTLLPDFKNRKQLVITIKTKEIPITTDTNVSYIGIAPVIVISVIAVAGLITTGLLLDHVIFRGATETGNLIVDTTTNIKFIVIGVAAISLIFFLNKFKKAR